MVGAITNTLHLVPPQSKTPISAAEATHVSNIVGSPRMFVTSAASCRAGVSACLLPPRMVPSPTPAEFQTFNGPFPLVAPMSDDGQTVRESYNQIVLAAFGKESNKYRPMGLCGVYCPFVGLG